MISRRTFVIAGAAGLAAASEIAAQKAAVARDDCVFCRIVAGTAPAHKLWEDKHFLAFLDHRPIMPGHLLIVPKDHHSYLFDMSRRDYDAILDRLHRLEPPLRNVMQAKRIGVLIEGFGVDHVHVHMIPITEKGQINRPGRADVTDEEFRAVAEKIRTRFKADLR